MTDPRAMAEEPFAPRQNAGAARGPRQTRGADEAPWGAIPMEEAA